MLSGNVLLTCPPYSKQIFQEIKPLRLDALGNIFLLLCTIKHPEQCASDSTPHLRHHEHLYTFVNGQWKEEFLALDSREKRILRLSIQGLNQQQIADKIYLSVDSVKKIRQHIFEKLGVNNIHDAIRIAENRRLI